MKLRDLRPGMRVQYVSHPGHVFEVESVGAITATIRCPISGIGVNATPYFIEEVEE